MKAKSMLLFLPRVNGKPVMLRPILFCPILTWVAQDAMDAGINQFFVVCEPEDAEEVLNCIPEPADVTICSFACYKESLAEFITSDTLLINTPVVPLSGGDGPILVPKDVALSDDVDLSSYSGSKVAFPSYVPLSEFSSLQDVTSACQVETIQRLLEKGVCALDPTVVYVDPRVRVGRGTMLLPGTILKGNTMIGEDCEIGPNSMVCDCVVGDGTIINASQAHESTIGNHAKIGPYSQIRPNCTIQDGAKIGDFVELKNAQIGEKTSVAHLTYLGDIDVGSSVNFGCGTVVCNYDGATKYHSSIGDNAFIGCNTNLISPVHIGKGAYIAAGSTVSKDVPEDALAISRYREQMIKENWAAKRRALFHSKY